MKWIISFTILSIMLIEGCSSMVSYDKKIYESTILFENHRMIKVNFHSNFDYDSVWLQVKSFDNIKEEKGFEKVYYYNRIFTNLEITITDTKNGAIIFKSNSDKFVNYDSVFKVVSLTPSFSIKNGHNYCITFQPNEKFEDQKIDLIVRLLPKSEL